MKIFILAIGTRGDLQAFLALGRQLRRRGHRVLLGTSSFYSKRVRDSELEWLQIGAGTEAQMHEFLRSMTILGDPKERGKRFIDRWVVPQLKESIGTIQLYAANADYFISNMKMVVRRRGKAVPGARVTYDMPETPADLAKPLGEHHEGRIIELVAMNKALVDPQDTWGGRFHFTGFWSDPTPAPWAPSERLLRFLSQGAPPVVITMGSMSDARETGFRERAIAAVHRAAVRAIVLGDWQGTSRVAIDHDNLLFEGEVPYRWLFPRAGCVVHHGGAGTVAEALSAGVPSVVVPTISAQLYLGRVLVRAQLATDALEDVPLDPLKLSDAILRGVREPEFLRTAERWRAHVAHDRGILAAADLVESHLRSVHQ